MKLLTTVAVVAALWGPLGVTGSVAAASPATAADPAQKVGSAQQAPNACADPAYSLLGGKWAGTLKWSFQSASSPSEYSVSAVLPVIKRSFDNMTGARNDCSLPDTVSATSSYQGSTSTAPGVTNRGFCSSRDGLNVVGFGPLPSGVLAVTCTWTNGNGRMVETDMRINSNVAWVLTLSACHYWQQLLEPVITHEVGHMYGLGHVGEQKHGRLTMSPYVDGPCENGESTLGLGDIRGLHHLYPL